MATKSKPDRTATPRATTDNDDPRVKAAVDKYARGVAGRGDLDDAKKEEMVEKYAARMRTMLPAMSATH